MITIMYNAPPQEVTLKVSLVSVYVNDPIEAFTYYTDVLGYVQRMYVPEAQLAIVASPEEPDGTGLLLEPNSNPLAKTYQEQLYQAGLPVLVFGVEDIQEEFNSLKKRGVVFRSEPTKTEWGTQALFDDTCGNLIRLHQI
jgi:predicted enzyme related to lactoylglutathione lyase